MANSSCIQPSFAGICSLSVAAALLALLAGLLALTQPARADTYVVTNNNNSGPGSLRQAITDANNNPGADTITFAAATLLLWSSRSSPCKSILNLFKAQFFFC